ncbi:MAG: hypothetical protein KGL17_07250 [Betaproteobacteria bacterium]|nr:hypothetical protein [Betaproteobacteria bacterium]
MPMTAAQIVAAVKASPTLSALAHQTPPATAAIAAALTATLPPVVGSVSVPVFAAWCASTGLRAVIEEDSNNSASPLRSAALAIKDLLAWQSGSLDLGSAPLGVGNVAMLQQWVTAGAISQAQHDALVALASTPDSVSEYEVRAAISDINGILLV